MRLRVLVPTMLVLLMAGYGVVRAWAPSARPAVAPSGSRTIEASHTPRPLGPADAFPGGDVLPLEQAPGAPEDVPARGDEDRAARVGEIDLRDWLNQNPLGRTPHRVVAASGGRPGATGVVSLRVVVGASLGTPALEGLARDLRAGYGDAKVFSALLFDSEEAATYDRHEDGGALAARHLVVRVVRDVALGVDTLQIRGVTIDP